MGSLNKFSPLENLTHLRILIAALSFILSILAISTDDLINADGILYTHSAEAFISGGLTAASSLFDWPALPILAAFLSKLLFLSPFSSLYLLNIVFFVVLTDALTLLVNQGSRNVKTTAIASMIILSFYTLNEYRDFIIRDTAYWAFSVLALFHLVNFLDTARAKSIHLWQLCVVSAALFRIEGLVVLLLMPLTVLFVQTSKNKFVTLAYIYLPFLVLGGLIAIVLLDQSDLPLAFKKVMEISRYIDFEHLSNAHIAALQVISESIVAPIASDQANTFFISGFLGILAFDIFTGLSVSFVILMILSYRENASFQHTTTLVISFFLIVNLLILLAFVFANKFMSTRYCMMAIISIALLFLPKITTWIQKSIVSRQKWSLLIIVMMLIISLADTFHQSSSKSFYKDAVNWSPEHIADDQKVFTNNEFVSFYLEQKNPELDVTHHKRRIKPCSYDYFFISDKHLHELTKKQIDACQLIEVTHFKNRKEKITIYKK